MAASSRRTRTVRAMRHVTNVVVVGLGAYMVTAWVAFLLHFVGIIVFGLLILAGAPVHEAWASFGHALSLSQDWWMHFGLIPSAGLALAVELWERPVWLARRARRWRFHSDSWDAPLGGERADPSPPV